MLSKFDRDHEGFMKHVPCIVRLTRFTPQADPEESATLQMEEVEAEASPPDEMVTSIKLELLPGTIRLIETAIASNKLDAQARAIQRVTEMYNSASTSGDLLLMETSAGLELISYLLDEVGMVAVAIDQVLQPEPEVDDEKEKGAN